MHTLILTVTQQTFVRPLICQVVSKFYNYEEKQKYFAHIYEHHGAVVLGHRSFIVTARKQKVFPPLCGQCCGNIKTCEICGMKEGWDFIQGRAQVPGERRAGTRALNPREGMMLSVGQTPVFSHALITVPSIHSQKIRKSVLPWGTHLHPEVPGVRTQSRGMPSPLNLTREQSMVARDSNPSCWGPRAGLPGGTKG